MVEARPANRPGGLDRTRHTCCPAREKDRQPHLTFHCDNPHGLRFREEALEVWRLGYDASTTV